MRRKWAVSMIALAVITLASWLSTSAAGADTVGGLVELYPWPEDAVNLVKNSSFEEVDSTGKVAGWDVGSPEHFSPALDVSRSGLRSLRLEDSHLAPYTPLASQPLALEPGWYTLRGWMKAVNAGTNTRGAGGRISVSHGKSPVISGTTDWTQVERRSFPILPGESASIRLEAYRKPAGTLFFDDIEVRRLIPPVVEGFLRYPNYRGILFDDRPQTIQMSVTLRPEEAKARLSDLTVRLSLSGEGAESAVASVEENPSKPAFLMTLDARTVLPGTYTLRLQALRQGTRALLFEYPPYRVVKLPAKARKGLGVYVDSDNVLVVNGQRTIVLGIYDTSGYSNRPSAYEPRISKIAEASINMYLNYWLGRAPVPALNALMTTLGKYGIGYLHTVNTWYAGDKNWPGTATCRDQTADALGQDGFTACMAAALGTNPGLVGWYTADERPADQVERVFHQYTILRQNNPGGVTFIAQNRPVELVRWRDAVDVMGVDPYPIYNIPEGTLSPLEMVTDWVEQAQAAVGGSRPVWAVIQFFKFGSKGHWPTYEELRTMSWMAIVEGAKGLFYWSYGAKGLSWVKDPEVKEQRWKDLVRVTNEIKSLEPALLSPSAPEILASHSPSGTIRILPRRVGETRYLIAVNNTPRAVQAEFRLSELARSVEVIGEGRTVELKAPNRFSDLFSAYVTHVYKIR